MLRSLAFGVGGFFGLLALLELVLRVLPVSTATMTGYHIDPLILSYPPGHRWRVATGWDLRNPQRLVANNMGFASPIDFQPDDHAVGLVGDSYIEASMLDEADRPAAQLAAAIGLERPVYGMGAPGSALLDYAERIRFAAERLRVHDFVVLLEAGDIRQSLCGSGNVHGPCLDRETLTPRYELQPPPSRLKQLARHSALAQYMFGQLKLDAHRLWAQAFSTAVPQSHGAPGVRPQSVFGDSADDPARRAARGAMVHAVTTAFFDRVRPFATGRLVLLVDGRRSRGALAQDHASDTDLLRERDEFVTLAAAHGAIVIDAEDVYRRHWARSDLSLDVGPYDSHLNRLGVSLLMAAAARALK